MFDIKSFLEAMSSDIKQALGGEITNEINRAIQDFEAKSIEINDRFD